MSIYFLRFNGMVKIGYSSKLAERVEFLMKSIPGDVEFVGHMPGERDLEAHLHDRFSEQRFSGEWFVESADLKAFARIALTPEKPTVAALPPRRREKDVLWRDMSDRVRKAAAKRWPEETHKRRKELLAIHLGWGSRRVKALYEADPRMRLWQREADELTALFGEELIAERHIDTAADLRIAANRIGDDDV